MRSICLALLLFSFGVSGASAAPGDPESQLGSLMERLRASKYEGALTDFFAGSLALKQKPSELKVTDGQIKAAFEFYGAPTTWEIVETRKIGKDLIDLKMLSKQKDDSPLFWNVLFYRRHESWEPISIDFFDDPKKAGFL